MDSDRLLITPDMTVQQALNRWPEVIPVFIRHRTACVGCSLSVFTTIRDVADTYNLDLSRLLEEMNQAILTAARS